MLIDTQFAAPARNWNVMKPRPVRSTPTGPTVSIILGLVRRRCGVAVNSAACWAGDALSLHVPLLVATAGYLIAIALAWTTIQGGRERRVRS